MNKKANNYMVIIIVLLLVVAIITGAGLCYLSWSDEYQIAGNDGTTSAVISTETPAQSTEGTGVTGDDLANAKEEGRQEVLDSIRENLEANISADDILNGLLNGESNGASTEGNAGLSTEGQAGASNTGNEGQAGTSTEGQGSAAPEGNAGTSTESAGANNEEAVLSANPVTMADIKVTADGEYQYIKDGAVTSHKGIDVSKYQETIDWKKVAADGIEYAFIRVGCRGYGSSGTLIKDDKFHQNVKGALAQDIQVGAYFFSQALTEKEAIEEAEMVIKELDGYDITYPVAIDIERVDGQKARQDALTKEERTEICIAFCERIKEAGYTPMVYGDLETFSELLDVEKLADYDFWICETDGEMTFPYEFAVWQYSHTGSVSGIKGETSISISLKEW